MDCCTPDPVPPMRLEAALARLARLYAPIAGTETVPLMAALGRVLAEPVMAAADVPNLPVSAMDGYALNSGAVPVSGSARLRVVGCTLAGDVPVERLAPGTAIRILTGAPVPTTANAVVAQEEAERDGSHIILRRPIAAGRHIRPAGEDMCAGDAVLPAGCLLRPQDIAAAATAGKGRLVVRRRLRAGLFSTGNELQEPGSTLTAGRRYDANRYAIGSALLSLGIEVIDFGILPDSHSAVCDGLAKAAEGCDLVITSGGVSVGDEDHVKAAVAESGTIDLWRLAIKPGKPIALGRLGEAAFLGLPGNPVSALLTFLLIGRPLVQRLMGMPAPPLQRVVARAGFTLTRQPGRREYLRARLAGSDGDTPLAHKFPNDSSGVITSMTWADSLIELPEDLSRVLRGDTLSVLPLNQFLHH